MTTHFTGRVVLEPDRRRPRDDDAAAAAGRPRRRLPTTSTACSSTAPPTRCWPASWRDGDATVGELAADLPANHARAEPLVAAPRLVELCFQTAGVAELATDGSLGLPRRVRRLQVAPGAAETAGSLGGRDRRARPAASTPSCSTARVVSSSASPATRPSPCPAPSAPTSSEPLEAALR